jgi:hypothetical protein
MSKQGTEKFKGAREETEMGRLETKLRVSKRETALKSS